MQNSIFWVETEKIKPNPYQPRRSFDEARLRELADSIRQYGVLQPLVVTRQEAEKDDGGLFVFYELLAGERRLRAARIAGVSQVPVVIKTEGADERMKLEIALIENIQREDLSPVERAQAFKKLIDEFGFKHSEIARKIGKSRVYVTNSTRLLGLPEEIINALAEKKITEGHTRPLLMLEGRPEEQVVLFKDILYKGITVREAERIAREIAVERARKKKVLEPSPEILEFEEQLAEKLGAPVRIEHREDGGQITIGFFSLDDVKAIINRFQAEVEEIEAGEVRAQPEITEAQNPDELVPQSHEPQEDEELYSVKNFTI